MFHKTVFVLIILILNIHLLLPDSRTSDIDLIIGNSIYTHDLTPLNNYLISNNPPFSRKIITDAYKKINPLICINSGSINQPIIYRDQKITVCIKGSSLPFNLISNMYEAAIISDELARILGVTILSGYFIEKKIGTDIYYFARLGIIDQIEINGLVIKNIPVKVINGAESQLSLSVFSFDQLFIDFGNGTIYSEPGTAEQTVNSYPVEIPLSINTDGFIKINTRYTRLNLPLILTFDIEERYGIINNFYHRNGLFESFKNNSLMIIRYILGVFNRDRNMVLRDADLEISGVPFYNRVFLINDNLSRDQINRTGTEVFKGAVIKIDKQNNILSIYNREFDSDYYNQIVQNIDLAAMEEFIRTTTNHSLRILAESKIKRWKGEMDNAIDILYRAIMDDEPVIKDQMIRELLIYTREQPNTLRIEKAIRVLSLNNNSSNADSTGFIYALKGTGLDIGGITGVHGSTEYHYANNKIMIRLKINGIETDGFVFDTGAPFIIIDRFTADNYNIRIIAKNILNIGSQFRDTHNISTDLGLIEQIDFNGIEVSNYPCLIIDRAIYYGINGVIGGGIINSLGYSINQSESTIDYRIGFPIMGNNNLLIINNKPFLPVTLERGSVDQHRFILFDTGSATSGISLEFANECSILPGTLKEKTGWMADIMGLSYIRYYVSNEIISVDGNSVKIDDFEFTDLPIYHSPIQVINRGFLGIDYLRALTIQE